jgi:hypothetical protein
MGESVSRLMYSGFLEALHEFKKSDLNLGVVNSISTPTPLHTPLDIGIISNSLLALTQELEYRNPFLFIRTTYVSSYIFELNLV